LRISLIVAAAAAAAFGAWPGIPPVPPFIYTAAARYEPAASPEARFPAGAAIILADGTGRRRLAPDFRASTDPAVSFDGRRILFAGQAAAGDPWQIWEAASGAAPRLVVPCPTGCVHPLYLPDDRIAFTRFGPDGSDIEVAPLAGGPAQRLTFAPGCHLTADVLRDGRILFESGGDLFTVYPDGTGVETLRCDHGPHRSGARQLASGDVVFTAAGRLARFASALAAQADVPQPATGLEPAGPVAEIAAGQWIISLRKPRSHFGLYVWNAADRSLSPLELAAATDAVQPAIVLPRIPPKEFPSALVETRKHGNLLCLDARNSKTPIDGEIRTVQVYTLDSGGAPLLLGRQQVAPDGSFYVAVPADRPLRIELLDPMGRPLRAERGWFWMRPSEQRICVGCHAGPERSPENRVPQILRHSTIPEDLRGPFQ
jgi:hypothetical protein